MILIKIDSKYLVRKEAENLRLARIERFIQEGKKNTQFFTLVKNKRVGIHTIRTFIANCSPKISLGPITSTLKSKITLRCTEFKMADIENLAYFLSIKIP